MKLIFEESLPGRHSEIIPEPDVPAVAPDFELRAQAPRLPRQRKKSLTLPS